MFISQLKHLCKKCIAVLVRPAGFVAAGSTQGVATDALSKCFATLHALNYQPQHIVDIGAHRGGWTRRARVYFPDCQFTLVEPQEQLKADAQDLITDRNIHWHTAGISDRTGTMMLTISARDDSCTFRHSPPDAQQLGLKQVAVPVFSLEDLLDQGALPFPDIIKIDAEGLDLVVLSGASRFLSKTEVFFLEAGVSQREFPNTLAKVVATMNDHGYRVFDITDLNRTTGCGALWLVELVFVRIGGKLDTAVSSFDD